MLEVLKSFARWKESGFLMDIASLIITCLYVIYGVAWKNFLFEESV
jgi:hypothetical protein